MSKLKQWRLIGPTAEELEDELTRMGCIHNRKVYRDATRMCDVLIHGGVPIVLDDIDKNWPLSGEYFYPYIDVCNTEVLVCNALLGGVADL